MALKDQFSAEVDNLIAEHPLDCSAFFVAYSAGMDSCVLLHLMAEYAKEHEGMRLYALHYNHGLQEEADAWQAFAQRQAVKQGVDFRSIKGVVDLDKTKGLEASARKARYQWFSEVVSEVCESERNSGQEITPVLLTAHHCDDQAETMLMNILRGTGLKGLRGIAAYKKQQNFRLVRPLLSISKQELMIYAGKEELSWIEDPSNTDTRFRRNAVRHKIMPEIYSLQPNAAKRFTRLSRKIVDAENILHEVAVMDLSLTELFDYCPLDRSFGLGFEGLRHLSVSRQLNAIRFWLESVGYPAESEMDLLKVLDWSVNGTSSGAELRRGYRCYRYFKDAFYVMPAQLLDDVDLGCIEWVNCSFGLKIDYYGAKLRHVANESQKYDYLRVAQRADVDAVLLPDGSGHISAKNCLQEAQVPPWRRNHALFVFDKLDRFVAVVGGKKQETFSIQAMGQL